MIPVAELLDFEATHPHHTGVKAMKIRALFGCSPTRYYLDLVQILKTTELLTLALEHDPTTTNRLIRTRDERAAIRERRTR